MSEEITSTTEEVKDGSQAEKFEVSKEEYEKLQEIEKNKSIALKREREEAQTLKQRLAEFEAKEKELEEKEKLKKGKYEEVIAEKAKLIEELEAKAKKYDEWLEKQTSETKGKIDELSKLLPKEVIDENSDILSELSDEKKIKLLERLVNQNKKPSFDSEIKGGDNGDLQGADIELNNAKSKGFDSFMEALIKKS
jgi:DNA repair exonuclease SbcCD ATPase subunit